MDKISVIVPCFNEEDSIPLFYREMERVAAQMPGTTLEYLFVDDGSKDGTLELLRGLHRQDPRVKYVSFSRNFGKESAIYAGLSNATGDLVAIMDADLQDSSLSLTGKCIGPSGRKAMIPQLPDVSPEKESLRSDRFLPAAFMR